LIPAAETRRTLAALAAGTAVAFAIGAFARLFFWPGVPMYDTVGQYRQVLGAEVYDWHPPVMVRLWQLLRPLGPGTAPMFVLQVALYAIGFGLLVATLVRIGRWWAALFVAALALSPLLLGWQMAVLKDSQMLGALLAAVGLLAWFRLGDRPVPLLATAAAVILIGYATLLRGNAVFATVPLAVLLLPSDQKVLPSVAIALVAMAAILALSPVVNHKLFRSEPSGIERVQPVFDLAAIAEATPGSRSPFTRSERAQIAARHCVKAYFWDPLGDPDSCDSATERLRDQPARKLYLELVRAIIRHPIAYITHRLAHWNSTERWLVAPGLPDAEPQTDAEPNDLGLVGTDSDFASSWQQWADDEMATPLGWPIVWTALALLLLPIAWQRREDPAAGVALALLASALTLEASFLVISIASDLRYHLWSMTASALALILLSNGIRIRTWERAVGAAALAAVIAGGVLMRASLPAAPDSYEGMLAAKADWL
jgi:hypothetical protein